MKTAAKPYADTRLVKFLEKRILELKPRKTQSAIASEAGFPQTNMLANIKTGANKLPLDRVPGLAKALESDPKLLFMMAVEQLGEDTTALAIRNIFGTIVSDNELDWIGELRSASDHADPSLTAKSRSAIRAIFNK